jgi:hypothetical protein
MIERVDELGKRLRPYNRTSIRMISGCLADFQEGKT